jgi:hypothetical protein
VAYEVVPFTLTRAFITNDFTNLTVGAYGNYYTYMPIPVENATYTGIMFMAYIPTFVSGINYIITPGPICDLTVTFASNATAALWLPVVTGMGCPLLSLYAVTFASNATAALWLPVTTNQTLINYWRESVIPVYGWYNQYDDLMGYWVWNYPS